MNDQDFKLNLNMLYEKRILNSQKMVDQLKVEMDKVRSNHTYLMNLKT